MAAVGWVAAWVDSEAAVKVMGGWAAAWVDAEVALKAPRVAAMVSFEAAVRVARGRVMADVDPLQAADPLPTLPRLVSREAWRKSARCTAQP